MTTEEEAMLGAIEEREREEREKEARAKAGRDKRLKNLRPIDNSKMTKEEKIANCRKGGIASGVAKRKKKELRKTLEDLLSMPIQEKGYEKYNSFDSAREKNKTVLEEIVLSMIGQCLNGNVKAFTALTDIIQPKESTKIEVNNNVNTGKLSEILDALNNPCEENQEDNEEENKEDMI